MNVTHKCSYYLNLNLYNANQGEKKEEAAGGEIVSSNEVVVLPEEPIEALSPMDTLDIVANFNKAALLNNKD